MSDGRWFEIDEDIAFAIKHFGHAASIYGSGQFETETLDGYRTQLAFLHVMQSGHTALEAALVRRSCDRGPSSHFVRGLE